MNDTRQVLPEACAEARRTIHQVLDGPAPAGSAQALTGHLSSCGSCREFQRGVQAVQNALRELPEIPFPDDALEEVWSKTVRARPGLSRRPGWWPGVAAAAALLLLAVLVSLNQGRVIFMGRETADRGSLGMTPEEIEQAAVEARQVLELTARALHRGRRAAFDEVLAGQVSPAIRRIPIQWPSSDSRRSKI